MLYSTHHTSLCRAIQSSAVVTSTNSQNTAVDDSFFKSSATAGKLTLSERFRLLRPLVATILQSIDIFGDESHRQSQAPRNSDHFEYLRARTYTYTMFFSTKINRFLQSNRMDIKAAPDVEVSVEDVRSEIEKAITQLLLIIKNDLE